MDIDQTVSARRRKSETEIQLTYLKYLCMLQGSHSKSRTMINFDKVPLYGKLNNFLSKGRKVHNELSGEEDLYNG